MSELLQTYWPLIVAALLLGLGLFAHQGFSTNLFGFATDVFPAQAVGSAVGIAATMSISFVSKAAMRVEVDDLTHLPNTPSKAALATRWAAWHAQ